MTDDPDPERATADFHGLRIARAAAPLPDPAAWIPEPGDLGDLMAPVERAHTDYCEFVSNALRRAYAGR